MDPRSRARTRPYEAAPPPGVPQRIDDDERRPSSHVSSGIRPGDTIGRYVIRNKLGRGGMGVVFGAYDPELGRRVALKLVRHRDAPALVEAHVDERLRREAQALARLSHPNVVALYDVGTSPYGDYLALALVPGLDLEHWLNTAEPRHWREIIDVFEQAGRGLAAAHIAGLIHRDFKPANVIVGPQGHVTVVDFGLARCAELETTAKGLNDSESSDDVPLLSVRLTGTNVIVGTRGYMAPEQLLGLDVRATADQFSFCVALFEALYGERPFPGRNAVETAHAYARGEIAVPTERRGVPPKVHEIIVRGLSIEPTDRFPSMAVLLDALKDELPRPRRRVRRLAGAVGLALACVTAGAWGQRMWTEAPEASAPPPVCETTTGAVQLPPMATEHAR